MMFGLGGYGVQSSDPNLSEKLAALKGSRKSNEDRVHDFLSREIGVDPRTLPFTYTQAKEYLAEMLDVARDGHDQAQMLGNSLGLNVAVLSGHDAETECLTRDAPGSHDWHDVTRAFNALVQAHEGAAHSFDISLAYPQVEVKPIAAPPLPHTDPLKYASGTVLRIERQDGDHRYIRIGGLYDDTTPTILDSLEPIGDLTGWSVTEEL